jgi:hypothetical protein
MRILLAAAATLAVVTVSGCDINTGPARQAKVECNCTGPAQMPAGMRPSTAYPPPPAEPYHHRWHRVSHDGYGTARWTGGHNYYWRREYAETSVVTYDYHSTSHSYYTDGSGGDAYAGGGSYTGGDAHGGGYHVVAHGWVDGYGRAHDGGEAYTDAPVHGETHTSDHHRGDTWHGYDVDCPNDEYH